MGLSGPRFPRSARETLLHPQSPFGFVPDPMNQTPGHVFGRAARDTALYELPTSRIKDIHVFRRR